MQQSEPKEWENFVNGSEQAFAQLYATYFRSLYNYASKFTPDKELVKDCIHDLFIELWERRANLSDHRTYTRYYLLKALRHTLIDALSRQRKTLREYDLEGGFELDFIIPHETQLIIQQFSEEKQEQIWKALHVLTPRQKEAIFLRFYNNLSYEEIASVMALNVDSSYNLIYRALSILRKTVSPISLILSLIGYSAPLAF